MSGRFDATRARVQGPVYPIPPAYDASGALDAGAVARYVAYLCEHGAKAVMVTAGTSRLNALTVEECVRLNRVVAEAAGPDILCIGATPPFGSLEHAADMVRRATGDGCHAVLLYYPERHYGDEVYGYYAGIAERTGAALMIHGVPLASGRGRGDAGYSMALLQRLAEIDGLVGIKEEFGDENFRYKLAVRLGDRLPCIVAGGSMRKFLSCALFGTPSWLVGVGSFVPEVEERFYAHFQAGEFAEALAIVTDIEEPLFDIAMPMGWHVAMRALLDIMGLMPGREREPMPLATAQERDALVKLARRLGWTTNQGSDG